MKPRIQPTPQEVVEVRNRAARALRGLRLHEGPVGAQQFGTTTGKKPHAESKFPTGFNMDLLKDGPPSKRWSLMGHFAYRVRETQNDHWELLKVVVQAEMDLAICNGTYVPIGGATDAQNVARLLRNFKGCHSTEVAVRESCEERWVRKSRIDNGLDPDYGDEPDRDERRARFVRMVSGGMSQREIAREVGVSAVQVGRILAAV